MNIVIAGFGVEGRASYDYWVGRGETVAIADERTELVDAPEGARLILGPTAFSELDGFGLIIRAPGVSPRKLPYGDKVWSATNEFFAHCTAPIIGVTGSKGKGTTASFIASILRASGRTVHLVGNIGQPALEALPTIQPGDIVVFELSSFQLWDIRRSPHIAVVLGIEPDHLDVHDDFADYVAAKSNIVKFQTAEDRVIYNAANEYSTQIAQGSVGQQLSYRFPMDEFASSIKLPGQHNVENAAAAIAAVGEYSIDHDVIRRGLSEFEGLPHRLKFVAEKHGIKYYDDSIATTPGSAIAAMRSFAESKVLILGGSDKGAQYDDVVAVAKETGTRVLAIGQTGEAIYRLCITAGVSVEREMGLMSNVVSHATQMAQAGDVVILSPASASFDQYANYGERGNQFVQAVEAL